MSSNNVKKTPAGKLAETGETPTLDVSYNKKEPTKGNPTLIPSSAEPKIHIREFSLEEQSKIEPLLQKKLHHSLISHRPGPGGTKAAYLEGNVVINLANSILGFNGWSFQIKELKIEHKERTSSGDFYVVSSCLVRIILKDGTFREDIGFGDIKNKLVGPAIENSKKGAITDGLKRALRLFGNSLGNCLYDKDFINKKSSNIDAESGLLIKKTDTYPELINSRVSTNRHMSPSGTYIKPEANSDYFEGLNSYLGTGSVQKRNIDDVYSNTDATPYSASKKINTTSPKNKTNETPHMNLNSAIKKEASKDFAKMSSSNSLANEVAMPPLATAENDEDDNFTDDSFDIEDLDREIAENELRKERVLQEEQRKKEDEQKLQFLEKTKPIEKLPVNLQEENLLFKSAASLKSTAKKSSEGYNLIDDLNELSNASAFTVKDESAVATDKPLLLNVNKSMKISSENFENVTHFRDLKNRKYIASAHEK
ncbi:hypothetical protein QEN19_000902 [Hanseniaspora menglaensis]